MLLHVLAGVGWYFFAPKATEHRDEAAPGGVAVKSGTFQDGEPLHEAEGTVTLLMVEGRHLLRC